MEHKNHRFYLVRHYRFLQARLQFFRVPWWQLWGYIIDTVTKFMVYQGNCHTFLPWQTLEYISGIIQWCSSNNDFLFYSSKQASSENVHKGGLYGWCSCMRCELVLLHDVKVKLEAVVQSFMAENVNIIIFTCWIGHGYFCIVIEI